MSRQTIDADGVHGGAAGLVALLVLQAWVWVASVLPKLVSGTFVSGFARFGSRPGWVVVAAGPGARAARALNRSTHREITR